MIRQLSEVIPVITSHGVGQKRILLSSIESGCSLTQIAVTELKAGEVATAHVHSDMQEAFFILEGELKAILDDKEEILHQETFVYVERCTNHEFMALADCRIMTIGCEI